MKLQVSNIYFQTALFIPGIGMVPSVTPENAKGARVFITDWGAEIETTKLGVWLVSSANITAAGPVISND
jgi:hypothetical protein